jgi:hypothetical protein
MLFALCCFWKKSVVGLKQKIMRDASKAWFKAMHKTIFIVWVHLCLLAIIGNGLIEAIGRQDPYSSQSKSYFNYGGLYVWLTVLVWLASLLQQLSYWIAVIENSEVQTKINSQPALGIDLQQDQTIRLHSSVLKELERKIGLNADWKWQPIAAQSGILFCLWGFLTYIDDENSVSGGFFGIIVQAAGPWSGLYAVKIIFNTLSFLLKRIYNCLKTYHCSPIVERRGWRRHQHDDLEDPKMPLHGLEHQRSLRHLRMSLNGRNS